MNRAGVSHRLRKVAMELNRIADDLDRLPLSEAKTARVRVFHVTHPDWTRRRLAQRFSITIKQVDHALQGTAGNGADHV